MRKRNMSQDEVNVIARKERLNELGDKLDAILKRYGAYPLPPRDGNPVLALELIYDFIRMLDKKYTELRAQHVDLQIGIAGSVEK